MTNREKLLKELAAMTNDQLEDVIYGDCVERMCKMMHADCYVKHEFTCPGGPNDCTTNLSDWFDWPCTHYTLTGEVPDE